jgi:hypothetical protein
MGTTTLNADWTAPYYLSWKTLSYFIAATGIAGEVTCGVMAVLQPFRNLLFMGAATSGKGKYSVVAILGFRHLFRLSMGLL